MGQDSIVHGDVTGMVEGGSRPLKHVEESFVSIVEVREKTQSDEGEPNGGHRGGFGQRVVIVGVSAER